MSVEINGHSLVACQIVLSYGLVQSNARNRGEAHTQTKSKATELCQGH